MSQTATQTDVELQSSMEAAEHPTRVQLADTTSPPLETEPRQLLKLISSGFSYFVAGTNDGSIGALLPYILSTYHIGPSFIAILYVTTFLGWLLAAFTNTHLNTHLPLGTLLALGSILQIIPQILRSFRPPIPLFAISFFLVALGQAYQDANANTYVSSVKGGVAHRWLGFVHAMYGLGLLITPFVSTAIANATPKWELFYLFPLGLGVANLVAVIYSFWSDLGGWNKKASGEVEGETGYNARRSEVKSVLLSKKLWIFSLFYFFYLGVATTSGGWIVEYLVNVRGGQLYKIGYVPAGAYGGIFLGRLLLAEPTHRYGSRRMLLLYAVICLVLQLVFWLVPNLVSGIVVFSVMGFFLGPNFAAGISVASNVLPKNSQADSLGMIFVIAQAGAALFPSLIGLIASRSDVQVLPPIVAGLIVAMGITWAFVPKIPAEHED